jgi:hypothetical protein
MRLEAVLRGEGVPRVLYAPCYCLLCCSLSPRTTDASPTSSKASERLTLRNNALAASQLHRHGCDWLGAVGREGEGRLGDRSVAGTEPGVCGVRVRAGLRAKEEEDESCSFVQA